MTKNESNNRIKGVLYGVAVGDALGAPLEWLQAHEIRRKYGTVKDMIGGGSLDLKPGEVTDDTQMTICVARGISKAPDSPIAAIGKHFIDWYSGAPKGMGRTCAMSIAQAIQCAKSAIPTPDDWLEASTVTDLMLHGESGGNGSLMRTAYPAIYYPDITTATRMAYDISRMTHHDPTAGEICMIYVRMIHNLITGKPESVHDTARKYGYLIDSDFKPKPTGYVVDSFKAALYALYGARSFEEAVVRAVNLGGDTDTIGAITGGLAGALYGYNAIPRRWLDCLDKDITQQIDALNQQALAHWD